MPEFRIVKLYLDGGLHLSPGLEGNYDRTGDVLHSDKIKSALFVMALHLYGAAAIRRDF